MSKTPRARIASCYDHLSAIRLTPAGEQVLAQLGVNLEEHA
ncbi:MAG TPA: hypothetical protein VGK74_04835 [Symbiobacteriaceae bacterium]